MLYLQKKHLSSEQLLVAHSHPPPVSSSKAEKKHKRAHLNAPSSCRLLISSIPGNGEPYSLRSRQHIHSSTELKAMEQEHQVYFAFGVLLVSQEISSESNAPLFLVQQESVTNPILPCTILRQCPAFKTRIILHGFFFYLHLRRGGNTLLHTLLK